MWDCVPQAGNGWGAGAQGETKRLLLMAIFLNDTWDEATVP